MQKIYCQKGFTVMELIVAILIIATLATISVAAFKSIETAKISRTVTEIDTIRKIIENYVRANALVTYQEVTPSNLVSQNADASRFWNADGSTKNINPWGGSYNVSIASPYNTYTITVTSVPSGVGGNITSTFQNSSKSASFSGGTVTLEFN